MKIIIVGCGKVGTTLAEQLNRENHDITLIDCDSEALQSISDSTDVMSVTGNGPCTRCRWRRNQGSGFADCHHQFR